MYENLGVLRQQVLDNLKIREEAKEGKKGKMKGEVEAKKKIRAVIPVIERFFESLKGYKVFERDIDVRILEYRFRVVEMFLHNEFLSAFYKALQMVNEEIEEGRPDAAVAFLKELKRYIHERMFVKEDLDYIEILRIDSLKTKGIYDILWEMLTLEFTFHHNEFKQEVESLIWLFFREVGLKDAELDDRWKNLMKLSKPTSRAFDDRSYQDGFSASGRGRIHDGDSEIMSEYQSNRNKFRKKQKNKIRLKTGLGVTEGSQSKVGESAYSVGSDYKKSRYYEKDADESFVENESQLDILEGENFDNLDWKECCLKVIDKIEEMEESEDFKRPVTKEDLGEFWDEYQKVITYPIDLTSIRAKIYEGEYAGVGNFEFDMVKIFDNCKLFNDPNSQIYECATIIEDKFHKLFKPIKNKFGESKKLQEAGIKISIGGIGI